MTIHCFFTIVFIALLARFAQANLPLVINSTVASANVSKRQEVDKDRHFVWGSSQSRSEGASSVEKQKPINLGNSGFESETDIIWKEDFDGISIGSIHRGTNKLFDWFYTKGDTPSRNTGPGGDHTSGKGIYIFAEASMGKAGNKAYLWTAPSYRADQPAFCIEFWYLMYGSAVGQLDVQYHNLENSDRNYYLWTKTGNQGKEWKRIYETFHVYNGQNFRIDFIATRGDSYTGDIALDDILVKKGPCSDSLTTSPAPSAGPLESCSWSDWSVWSGCSSSCGPGTTSRKRTCSSNEACCKGLPEETLPCVRVKCFQDIANSGCHFHLRQKSGSFTSPNYPKGYFPNTFCTWLISGQSSERIELSFSDFDVEHSRSCRFDSLSIYDGPSNKSSLLVRACGTLSQLPNPPVINSSADHLFLQFKTDNHYTERGFKATYLITNNCTWSPWSPWGSCSLSCGGGIRYRDRHCSGGPGCCTGDKSETSNCNPHPCDRLKDCENILRSKSGLVQSPNYPRRYNNNQTCEWKIDLLYPGLVQLTFLDFQIEYHRTCRYDEVKVFSGLSSRLASNLLFASCGFGTPNPANVTSSNNKMTVLMKTDGKYNYKGFQAEYKLVETCTWSTWSAWGLCSTTCDIGKKVRTRSCSQSTCCVGDSQESESCISEPCSNPSEDCGIRSIEPVSTGRIIGGDLAVAHSWPWQARLSLVGTSSLSYLCGGTIISPDFVITAAHCVYQKTLLGGILMKPSRFRVIVGDHDREVLEFREDMYRVKNIIPHENYRAKPLSLPASFDHDIALLQMSQPITLSHHVRPICLPDKPVESGTWCYTSGWGFTTAVGQPSRYLMQLYLPVHPLSTCQRPDSYGDMVTPAMLCAGYPQGGRDTCQGDSGGPLMCEDPRRGRWVLHGITSFGDGCARERKPGVYTRVSHYRSWIQSKTGI